MHAVTNFFLQGKCTTKYVGEVRMSWGLHPQGRAHYKTTVANRRIASLLPSGCSSSRPLLLNTFQWSHCRKFLVTKSWYSTQQAHTAEASLPGKAAKCQADLGDFNWSVHNARGPTIHAACTLMPLGIQRRSDRLDFLLCIHWFHMDVSAKNKSSVFVWKLCKKRSTSSDVSQVFSAS